jgi:hypothetical protein
VRADFPKDTWNGTVHSRGTINVDFNPHFREVLARLGALQWLELDIGANELRVASPTGSAVERRVTFPARWLKAFVEVQACQSAVNTRLEVSGVEARRFLHALPANTQARTEAWAAPQGSGLRLTHRPSASAVRIAAWQQNDFCWPRLVMPDRQHASDDSTRRRSRRLVASVGHVSPHLRSLVTV